MIFKKILLLGIGGFIGSNLRFWITRFVDSRFLGSMDNTFTWPWGTFAVNIVGCFFLGLLYQAADSFPSFNPDVKLLIGVGLLGALTTFSTFSVETINLIQTGETGAALGNMLLSCGFGFGAAFLGMKLIRLFS